MVNIKNYLHFLGCLNNEGNQDLLEMHENFEMYTIYTNSEFLHSTMNYTFQNLDFDVLILQTDELMCDKFVTIR